ncbi:lipase family protein [Actinoplanes regularis]|uniref:Secretory lipase n=1 Tax=Actinoplanes regularis TaxID=52697 RepID=A0A239B7Q5_9ACTN|nr:lipase family protein [Actinoplanes regularis]GIE87808.1 triacylglycerol lipase [Actinoplanes regularis]SNS03799.1 Secretory lipase [Actinoplanes regularis]
MSIRTRITAALLAASVVGAGVAPPPAGAADNVVTSRGVEIPAFYTPPATLPAVNGTLIRTEALPLTLSLPGIKRRLPGTATRIMYKSTDSAGQAVAVSGAYLEPAARWREPGPRPLVVFAPGTMGQGDQCSTSLGLQRGLVLQIGWKQSTVSIDYEMLAIYRLLSKGVAVVETDYIGLGTTDRLHTFVNRLDSGHAVLDAARAAKALPDTSITADSAVGLYGYSQGGGAAAAAAELQPSYAPDVALKATYAGAPPANITEVTAGIDGTELVGTLGWSVNGFIQSQPELQPLLDRYLNDAGRAALKDLSTMCASDSVLAYANTRSSTWTVNGQSMVDIIRTEPLWQDYINAQLIGTLKPTGAVRVATGVNDNAVPHAQARMLAVDWCRLGADVTYAPIKLPKVGSPVLNHAGAYLADQGPAVNWLTQRLAGLPASSTCASLPNQP